MTVRQRQVLRLMSLGHTYHEIAVELGIGYHTVRDHAKAVRKHLRARTKAHAVAIGFQTGLLR